MPPKYHDVRDVPILGYSDKDALFGRGAFRAIIGFGSYTVMNPTSARHAVTGMEFVIRILA